MLHRWSGKAIGDEDDGDFLFPAVYRRKGTEDWRLLGSSLRDSFNQEACRGTALLLVHLMVAGEASNDGGNGEEVRPGFRLEKKLRQ